ncbi:AMP-binding protein [Gordonia sp. PDNC005]|uniref:AMP-binding protein n=1 Tax=Gordonia sp. PDNC005 TaxID=2811424 RepID=UPI001F05C62C|nr:AMP-binding protein [Gordonia sp. PDNC005]
MADLLDTAARTVRSALVVARSGVADVTRPDHALASVIDMRTIGPLATPVASSARRYPDRIAVIDGDRSISYAELDAASSALAASLVTRGCTQGRTVGVLCRDGIGSMQAMIAASKTGARVVLLNTAMAGPQVADIVAREHVTLLAYDAEFSTIAEMCEVTDRVVVNGGVPGEESVADLIAEGVRSTPAPRPKRPGSMVLLTGGTTGLPKGAERSVRNPLDAAGLIERIPLPRCGVVVCAAPLFHGTGLSQVLYSMSLGSTIVPAAGRSPGELWELIERHRATSIVLVPTILQRLLAVPDHMRFDASTVEVIFTAGSLLPGPVAVAALDRFGPVLYNLYGSSEVSVVSVATPEDLAAAPTTAGRPPSVVRTRIYDENARVISEPGRVGSIHAGSALAFDGYTGGGTKDRIDGLLATGDRGHWDADGRLFVDGRDDDMIVSGGENVYPGEVEDLILAHDDVLDAAVVGTPDDEFGQRLVAVVVRGAGSTVTADEIRAHVKQNLARYKTPREVHFVDDLPRTAAGKLLRRTLVERYRQNSNNAQP